MFQYECIFFSFTLSLPSVRMKHLYVSLVYLQYEYCLIEILSLKLFTEYRHTYRHEDNLQNGLLRSLHCVH